MESDDDILTIRAAAVIEARRAYLDALDRLRQAVLGPHPQTPAPGTTMPTEKPVPAEKPNLPAPFPHPTRPFVSKPNYQGKRPCFSVDRVTGKDIAWFPTLTAAAIEHGTCAARVSESCRGVAGQKLACLPVGFRYATPTRGPRQ